jgi:hypothetical protein
MTSALHTDFCSVTSKTNNVHAVNPVSSDSLLIYFSNSSTSREVTSDQTSSSKTAFLTYFKVKFYFLDKRKDEEWCLLGC